jgi:hypothetical protein
LSKRNRTLSYALHNDFNIAVIKEDKMNILEQIREHAFNHMYNPNPNCCYCIGLLPIDEKEIEHKVREDEKKYLKNHPVDKHE